MIVARFDDDVCHFAIFQIIQVGDAQSDLDDPEQEHSEVIGPLRCPYWFFPLLVGFCCAS